MTLQEVSYIQNIIAAGIAAIAAIGYNMVKHRHDREVFKSEIFFSFNQRYEKLSDSLDDIVSWEANIALEASQAPHQNQDLDDVIDDAMSDPSGDSQKLFRPLNKYIALCSEQYYWYKRGLVDEEVWFSWRSAMVKWHEWSLSFKRIIENEKERKVPHYEKDFLLMFEPS